MQLFDAETISVHMTEKTCTLDLPRHLSGEQHRQAEQLANQVVQSNRPVRAAFIGAASALFLAYMKPADVPALWTTMQSAVLRRAAKVLGRLGNVDNKIRKEVVNFIAGRLESDAARAATVVDISRQIDNVWHQAVSLPER